MSHILLAIYLSYVLQQFHHSCKHKLRYYIGYEMWILGKKPVEEQ
jgi:hypothetical protein